MHLQARIDADYPSLVRISDEGTMRQYILGCNMTGCQIDPKRLN
jgi:hypothetical protein